MRKPFVFYKRLLVQCWDFTDDGQPVYVPTNTRGYLPGFRYACYPVDLLFSKFLTTLLTIV